MRTFGPMEMLGADMKSKQYKQVEPSSENHSHVILGEFIKDGDFNHNLELWWSNKKGYLWTLRGGKSINGTYEVRHA